MYTISGVITYRNQENIINGDQYLLNILSRELYFFCKRCFDVLLSSLLLLVLSPIILVIAILIKLDSPGPAIFIQKRVGARRRWCNGSPRIEVRSFDFFKFRTMYCNSGDKNHREFIEAYIRNDLVRMAQLQSSCANGAHKYKLNGDRRVTRIGKFLRKSSLDELPQFWNIIKGDMSLVGPRPPIPYEVEMYDLWHRQRLETIPGLTGLWQVEARSSCSFDEMARLDIQYIEKQTFWLDLKILFLTPFAVLTAKGAE